MAWTERLESGKYRGGWRDPAGKKCYTKRPEFPEHPYARRRDALEAAQEAEVKARRKAAVEQGTVSASITFGEWWEHVAPQEAGSNTAANAERIASKYLIPKWGETPLNRIQQRDAKAWVADLVGKGLEPSYVQRIFAELRRAINLALDNDPPILTASPCAGVKLPKIRKKAKSFLDDDDMAALKPHLHARYMALTWVALETGLRPGELCGLHARSVDLDTGWITVEAVYVDKLHRIRWYPKDSDSRPVPLTVKAVDIIRTQLAGRDVKADCGVPHIGGGRCGSCLVFRNIKGDPVTPQAWYCALEDAAPAAKLSGCTPYAARRGFATRAARGGLDAFELAEIMGHADVRQTREYVQQSAAARDRLRAALGDGRRLRVAG